MFLVNLEAEGGKVLPEKSHVFQKQPICITYSEARWTIVEQYLWCCPAAAGCCGQLMLLLWEGVLYMHQHLRELYEPK